MSNRLNQEREEELQPKRMEYAKEQLTRLGIEFEADGVTLMFYHRGYIVRLWPYSGWHSGKSITDGRGIEKLLKQLK